MGFDDFCPPNLEQMGDGGVFITTLAPSRILTSYHLTFQGKKEKWWGKKRKFRGGCLAIM